MTEAERLIDALRDTARTAANRAYSPYSRFAVGAAVRHPGGVQAGCNVENGSYGLTQCAERNALAAAIAAGADARSFDALLVYRPGERAWPPCGACRQVMLELLAPGALVVACCDGMEYRQWQVEDLLPDAFDMEEHGHE